MSSVYQKSFAAGEITTSLYGRVDTIKYQTGLRTCRNWFIARHGGAFNRPGSIYKTPYKDQTKRVRLIPFKADNDSAYALEFGHLYVRPLKFGQPIPITAKSIDVISKSAAAVVQTTTAHGFVTGDIVGFSGVVGMTQINGLTGTVTVISSFLFSVNINSSAFSNYVSGGTVTLSTPRNVQLVTPYTEDVLRELNISETSRTMTIAHQSAMPQEITYVSDESWSIADVVFGSGVASPTGLTQSGSAGTSVTFYITAISNETFEESIAATIQTGTTPSSGTPVSVTWNTATGVSEWNVYKQLGTGPVGLIGITYTAGFTDNGIPADYTDPPPELREPIFDNPTYPDTKNLPAAVGFFQQRRFYGNIGPAETGTLPSGIDPRWDPKSDRIIGSRIGSPTNFNVNRPIQDDDSVSFRLLGKFGQEIRHFIDIGKLAVFTAGGEWIIGGDTDGVITPSKPNPQQYSYNGASKLAPIVIGGAALYVQARGSIIRSFGFDIQVDGYRGSDLTIFSAHLVDGYELVDWTYQQTPHSIVWIVRDDGTLIGMTFVPEQNLIAFHRHDFANGEVESICTVPEGNEDVVYVAIKRTIDGATVRYVERLATRRADDILESIFVDSAVSYDGRNTNDSHTMTVSGGTAWDENEQLTITSSTSFFAQADEDDENAIHMRNAAGDLVRFFIEDYTNATTVLARPDRTVPVNMRSTALSTWTKAIKKMTGLGNLEGRAISALGDGFVAASAHRDNDDLATLTVENGEVTFPQAYGVLRVGEPIIADLETLNIDTVSGESMIDKQKLPTHVAMWVEKTRGLFVGAVQPSDEDPIEGLTTNMNELKVRYEEDYDDPIALKTDIVKVNIQGRLTGHGRVLARQIDPLPAAVLAISPSGYIPMGA